MEASGSVVFHRVTLGTPWPRKARNPSGAVAVTPVGVVVAVPSDARSPKVMLSPMATPTRPYELPKQPAPHEAAVPSYTTTKRIGDSTASDRFFAVDCE